MAKNKKTEAAPDTEQSVERAEEVLSAFGDEIDDEDALVHHQELADALAQVADARSSLRELLTFITDRGVAPRNDRQREMLERARALAGEPLPPASDPV